CNTIRSIAAKPSTSSRNISASKTFRWRRKFTTCISAVSAASAISTTRGCAAPSISPKKACRGRRKSRRARCSISASWKKRWEKERADFAASRRSEFLRLPERFGQGDERAHFGRDEALRRIDERESDRGAEPIGQHTLEPLLLRFLGAEPPRQRHAQFFLAAGQLDCVVFEKRKLQAVVLGQLLWMRRQAAALAIG